jgi:hypothetical protein
MRRRAPFAIAGAVVLAGIVVAAVLTFPTSGPGRGTARPTELPAQLEPFVFNLCMPSLAGIESGIGPDVGDGADTAVGTAYLFSTQGSGNAFTARIEEPGAWRVDAGRRGATVLSEDGHEDGGKVPPVFRAVTVAEQMYDCLAPYRFVEQSTLPSSPSKLLQLYKYDNSVLWPCLAAHGLKVGDPPNRADFTNAFTALTVDPFVGLDLSRRELPRLISAVQDCPLRPSYLR